MTAPNDRQTRDWPVLLLVLITVYLALFIPPAVFLGAKAEVLGGAVGILVTTLGGILGIRAAKK
jgi:hypothetical protein